jgi:NOL1/NOP2/fmu family ribosome biogenesis protein
LKTEINGKSILEWGKILLNISNRGLIGRNFKNKTGNDETIFLKNIEQILQQNKTKAEKTLENFERFWVSIGIVGFRISRIEDKMILKPTTNFIQLFGKEFKKKIYELDNWEEVKLFVNGKNLEIKEKCDLRGYVVVKYEEHYLGCGRIEGKTLRNLVPKDRRILIKD